MPCGAGVHALSGQISRAIVQNIGFHRSAINHLLPIIFAHFYHLVSKINTTPTNVIKTLFILCI